MNEDTKQHYFIRTEFIATVYFLPNKADLSWKEPNCFGECANLKIG